MKDYRSCPSCQVSELVTSCSHLELFQRRESDIKLFAAFPFKVNNRVITIQFHDSTDPEELVLHAVSFADILYILRFVTGCLLRLFPRIIARINFWLAKHTRLLLSAAAKTKTS